MKKLPVGISDFKKLREQNRYFVDKSMFIKEIIEEAAEVILLPRPRRFGKTLNLSMLRWFFEISDKKEERRELFSGLEIEKKPLFEKHLAKYPVIFLTFKDIKFKEFNTSLNAIKRIIAKEFRRHKYLLESSALDQIDKEEFTQIMKLKADESLFAVSLQYLSEYLYNHCQKKTVILIDEYDTPIHAAYENGYYDDCISFFRSFLGAGLKDNEYLFKGVLTGILRVAKESIFSDMNNLGIYSFLSHKFSDKFGITGQELSRLLKYCQDQEQEADIKSWYDGYIFGEHLIYNPWSIISYLSNIKDGFKPYWVNTSSDDMIKELIRNAPENIKTDLHDLINNIPITKTIDENIVFNDLTKDETTIYSFLLFSGYLKAFDKKQIGEDDYYKLLIPNLEVKQVFKKVIMKWIKGSGENVKLQKMLDALVKGDIKVFSNILSDFVINTLSYFDTEKKSVEKVYQAFILGMLVNLAPGYEVKSDRESGYGRYDISVIPKDITKKAIIMELKTINTFNQETKDQALASALNQIQQRKYETEIIERGITDIIKLGVVFDHKRVWVKT